MGSIGDLGWFERMARRAAQRSAEADTATSTARLLEENAERVARIRLELEASLDSFLAGPPEGCWYCFSWSRGKIGWAWNHTGAIDPELRPWPEEEDGAELVEHCTHRCHGPEGFPCRLSRWPLDQIPRRSGRFTA